MASVPTILLCQLVASWNGTARQTCNMIGNFAGADKPNFVSLRVIHEVFENSLQMFEAERLSYHKGVQGEAHDEWLFLAFFDHDVELVDRHFCKI